MVATSDLSAITTEFKGIAHLLRDQQLEVPAYQRSYSWGSDEVLAYWHDLRAALIAEQPVYFLGTVVPTRADDDERSMVIDGQQRLATTSMLMAAIRDLFQENGDEGSATQIGQRYVATTSLLSQQVEPKLLLNHADRGPYETAIVRREALQSDQTPDSGKRLNAAYQLLRQVLTDDVNGAGPYWRQRLLEWVTMLDQRTRVIVVSVRDDADAFMIFETLNDRGLALTIADLVKNYFFGLCRAQIGRAEDLWLEAVASFDEAGVSLEFTTFLRQWWTSENGATRERDLYKRIRSAVTTQSGAFAALESIAAAAPTFVALADPEHPFWSDFPVGTTDAVRALNDLGLEQNRPLLLAGLNRLSRQQAYELLRAAISWSVRGLIVGGIGGGTTERAYAEAAVEVSKGRVQSVAGVLDQVHSVVPSDTDFRTQFAQRRVHKLALINYYLRALDVGDAVPNSDMRTQKIVPIVTRQDYEGYLTADEGDPIDKRVANYLLMPPEQAEVARRAPVSVRLGEVGARSVGEWVASGFTARQSELAALAVETWPR
ncbi:MAG: DUF262 domain-containing protein [Comamonadaceae bacterium]|nr:MAG: DUF262 domain-containing protein [Comamonadaceae bacterium]